MVVSDLIEACLFSVGIVLCLCAIVFLVVAGYGAWMLIGSALQACVRSTSKRVAMIRRA